jgi:hypothetical protein
MQMRDHFVTTSMFESKKCTQPSQFLEMWFESRSRHQFTCLRVDTCFSVHPVTLLAILPRFCSNPAAMRRARFRPQAEVVSISCARLELPPCVWFSDHESPSHQSKTEDCKGYLSGCRDWETRLLLYSQRKVDWDERTTPTLKPRPPVSPRSQPLRPPGSWYGRLPTPR